MVQEDCGQGTHTETIRERYRKCAYGTVHSEQALLALSQFTSDITWFDFTYQFTVIVIMERAHNCMVPSVVIGRYLPQSLVPRKVSFL